MLIKYPHTYLFALMGKTLYGLKKENKKEK